MRKSGLKPGDALYLTKPIGTGTILSAAKNGRTEPGWVEAATESMLRLNRHAMHLAREAGVAAATDVTGFGLLGHLWEMCERSGVAADIAASAVPLLPGAAACSALGVHTGGEGRNREWAAEHVGFEAGVDADRAALLYDPQTSGGLLFGCAPRRSAKVEAAFARDGVPLWRIGRVTEGRPEIRVGA
jgi:selenide,water dikinase